MQEALLIFIACLLVVVFIFWRQVKILTIMRREDLFRARLGDAEYMRRRIRCSDTSWELPKSWFKRWWMKQKWYWHIRRNWLLGNINYDPITGNIRWYDR